MLYTVGTTIDLRPKPVQCAVEKTRVTLYVPGTKFLPIKVFEGREVWKITPPKLAISQAQVA